MVALTAGVAAAESLQPLHSRDRRVIRSWSLPGQPRGIAIGTDGTAYIGLAKPQAVVAVDPKSGTILERVVLDHPEIASTKELLTLRITPDRKRLLIANGSDESASILSLPDLGILREITLEGETVRDFVPDPQGRYLYVLGRTVHVYDEKGERDLRTLASLEPMAIAPSPDGNFLAVIGSEQFQTGPATMLAIYDTERFREITRQPLQTDRNIVSAIWAAGGDAIVVIAPDWLAEKRIRIPTEGKLTPGEAGIRLHFEPADFPSSHKVCLPGHAGAEIATTGESDRIIYFAERRCGDSGAFLAQKRLTTDSSLYGVDASALAFNPADGTIYATDPSGSFTIYNPPRPDRN